MNPYLPKTLLNILYCSLFSISLFASTTRYDISRSLLLELWYDFLFISCKRKSKPPYHPIGLYILAENLQMALHADYFFINVASLSKRAISIKNAHHIPAGMQLVQPGP